MTKVLEKETNPICIPFKYHYKVKPNQSNYCISMWHYLWTIVHKSIRHIDNHTIHLFGKSNLTCKTAFGENHRNFKEKFEIFKKKKDRPCIYGLHFCRLSRLKNEDAFLSLLLIFQADSILKSFGIDEKTCLMSFFLIFGEINLMKK